MQLFNDISLIFRPNFIWLRWLQGNPSSFNPVIFLKQGDDNKQWTPVYVTLEQYDRFMLLKLSALSQFAINIRKLSVIFILYNEISAFLILDFYIIIDIS